MLNITNVIRIHTRHLQEVCQLVKFLLWNLLLIDNNCIIQVTTLNQVSLQEWHNVTYKNECTFWSNLGCISIDIIQCSKLTANKLRVKVTHRSDRELLVRENSNDRAILILNLNLLANDIVILWSILVNDTNLIDFINIHRCRTIEDREFWAINLYKTVINTHCIKGRHTMFYRTNTCLTLSQYCSTLCVNNILSNSINNRLSIKIDSLYLIASIFRGRVECYSKTQSCMKSLSEEGKTSL